MFQLCEITKRVPKEIEPDVKNKNDMDEVWEILDHKYRQAVNICGEAVEELRTMVPSGKTSAHKFISLFRKYTQVKNDLVEFGRLRDLDNLPVIKALTMKFPDISIKKSYADYRMGQKRIDENVSEFDVLDEFTKWEKNVQQDILKMDPQENDSKSADSKNKDADIKCLKCGEMGHRRANCKGSSSRSGGSGDGARVNLLATQPGKPCPACQSQHTLVSKNGETLYKSRLSSCTTWRNMSLQDRALLVEKVKGALYVLTGVEIIKRTTVILSIVRESCSKPARRS